MDALYARMPKLVCRGLCSHSCGPIECSDLERRRIHKASGALVGFRFTVIEPGKEVKPCAALDCETKLCNAYAVRPVLCRLFGSVEKMRCPHGCEPERWLTDQEARDLLDEANRIGGAPSWMSAQ